VGLSKTRMAAKRLCEIQKILLNGKSIKPSQEVLAGDSLELFLPSKNLTVKILQIPAGKSLSKKERPEYIQFLNANPPEHEII
jgi:ribosomal 50S subunit-recycling heat shock protein